MEIIQKLEIAAGIATSASILFILLIFIGFAYYEETETNTIFTVSSVIASYGLFSLMVSGGAYYHAAKQSRVAAVVLAIGVLIVIAVSLVAAGRSGGGLTLLMISPAIFALLTGIFALFDR